jgi:hypothetical protein
MGAQTTFELYTEASTQVVKPLSPGEANTLLAGGIVNPFGPTLNVLVAGGKWEPGRTVAILHAMLNPFQQGVREVGRAQIGDTWNLPVELRRFFRLPFGSCPTMLLPSKLMNEASALETYSEFLTTFQDGFSKLEDVRRFAGDPWSRVQAEVDRGMDVIAKAVKQVNPGPVDKPHAERALSMAEARELAGHLLQPSNLILELQAFFVAWDGAIKSLGDGPMAKQAMSIDDFSGIFDVLAESCVLPPLGE